MNSDDREQSWAAGAFVVARRETECGSSIAESCNAKGRRFAPTALKQATNGQEPFAMSYCSRSTAEPQPDSAPISRDSFLRVLNQEYGEQQRRCDQQFDENVRRMADRRDRDLAWVEAALVELDESHPNLRDEAVALDGSILTCPEPQQVVVNTDTLERHAFRRRYDLLIAWTKTRGRLQAALRSGPISVASYVQASLAIERHTAEHGKPPSHGELAKRLRVSRRVAENRLRVVAELQAAGGPWIKGAGE